VRAIVTLANGVKYQGSWAKTKEQAAESAASSALLDVVSKSFIFASLYALHTTCI